MEPQPTVGVDERPMTDDPRGSWIICVFGTVIQRTIHVHMVQLYYYGTVVTCNAYMEPDIVEDDDGWEYVLV